jgi:predicted RND superfamily exporter protein
VTGLKVALVLVLVLLLLAAALRIRKVRRDENRALEKKVDRRLLLPPPSPYHPSRGFRLLGENDEPIVHESPPLPSIDIDRQYVFSDYHPPVVDATLLSSTPRDLEWALSRSAHRSNTSGTVLRILAVVLVIALLIGVVSYYDHSKKKTPTSTTTTTVVTTTTLPAVTTTS